MSIEHRIETMESFRVVGRKISTSNENGKGYQEIPAFWGELLGTGGQMEILPLMDQKPYGLLGINVYNTEPADAQKFDYYIACASDKQTPEGFFEYTVPALTWAVFPCKRGEEVRVMGEIVTDWLPQSEYDLVNSGYETGAMAGGAPDIEVYSEGDDVEIWIAVKKK